MRDALPDLHQALERIDAVNATDPRVDGETPKELLYGRRMSDWLAKLVPQASNELQIACRGHHIARWQWPRSEYPDGRNGYKTWRRDLLGRHAETVVGILSELGYSEQARARVASLIRKQDMRTDAEAQSLEDVACMVFLEFEFGAFAAKHERDKVIRIVQKTWQKMSETARAAALQLEMAEETSAIVKEALS